MRLPAVIDTHVVRGGSNGGSIFHDRGGPYGGIKGVKGVVAVDVTGLPVGVLVVPASTHANDASDLMLDHLRRQAVTERLELILVGRGATAAAARRLGRHHDLELRRVGTSPSGQRDPPGALRRSRVCRGVAIPATVDYVGVAG